MYIRYLYSGIFLLIMLTLITCAVNAKRHYKDIGKAVAELDIALIPPILGNAVMIMAQHRWLALVGCYIYFIGMDVVVFSLMNFTKAYCEGIGKGQKAPPWIRYILFADVFQLLLNPLTKHAFDVEWLVYKTQVFYEVKPLVGQYVHRLIVYGVFIAVILIFAVATIKTSKIYRERYSVIFVSMISVGVWQSYYIFTRNPIDRSMIGFGLFGILVFYFSIIYRPLKLLDRMLSGILSNDEDACFIFTPRGRCVWANKAACLMVGVQEQNCEKAPGAIEYLFNLKPRSGNWTEQHSTGAGDNIKYYLFENRDVVNEKGRITGFYLSVKDNTEEQLKIRKDLYEATHDRQTSLYTKDHLFKLIRQTVDVHKDTEYLILYIDIKYFKVVNDIFGNDFGDYAIMNFAGRLKDVFSKNCLYGKLSGAKFGALIPKDEFDQRKIENELCFYTVKKDQVKYPVHVQIGVYEIDRSEEDVSVMFSNARIAQSTIENDDSKFCAFYDDDLRNEILWDQKITTQITDAIKNQDIRPFLQPIADRDGNIVGCEALVRWIHKDYGTLPPMKFIPSFEKNGMIVEIDKYMWRCACMILAEWKKRGWNMFISVNISPKDFYYLDVPQYIAQLVEEHDVDPKKLRVEITETVMITDTDKMIEIMEQFRDYGFIVEMDDFGSGYSSLSMLKSMPVDVLKIDMNFLGTTDEDKKADTIVKNVINLSMDLGMVSLTEGVETREQYNFLCDQGCKLFQGYYFSKPVPRDEFEELVISKR